MKKNELIFVGIDQTGAVDSKKRPKPLPACFIQGNEVHLFYLPSLSLVEIQQKTLAKKVTNLYVCVDCVLGLPLELNLSWSEALHQLKNIPGFGREPAAQFFRQLGQGQIPRRKIEIQFKANSVFQEKPFQKNIQTGTFRLWKDIFHDRENFYVPALESRASAKQVPLFEGYPSLSWKLILDNPKRDPRALREILKLKKFDLQWTLSHQKKVEKDPNLADAFVLALTMKICHPQVTKIIPHPEGSILMDEKLL